MSHASSSGHEMIRITLFARQRMKLVIESNDTEMLSNSVVEVKQQNLVAKDSRTGCLIRNSIY